MVIDKYFNNKGNYIILFLIILTGAVLRLFDAFHIQYTYDELSALSRTYFTSLNELIEKGVKPDFHPLGIQVFLYYYTKLFGYSEFAIKLPFIIAGIVSIWLTYDIAKRWFNEHVALLSAALIATIQYTVMYSQIARPYGMGMLLSLLLVHFFTCFFIEKRHSWKNAILIGLFAALSGYNHHFNFLFSLIVLATGLLFTTKPLLKYYVTICVLTVFLYLPELPVTLHQMKIGGVGGPDGWLEKPSPYFFPDYIRFILHYSTLLYFIVTFSIVTGIILSWKTLNNNIQKRLLMLIWFILPFFIGYYYSVLRNPVLQFSILIFGFPYFVIFIFSFWGDDVPVWVRNSFVAMISVTSICTLIVNREYYTVFYHQNIETFYNKASEQLKEHPNNTLVLSTYDKDFNLYQNKYGNSFTYTHVTDTMSAKAFKELIKYGNAEYLVLGGYDPFYIELAKEDFPYIIKKEKSFLLNFHVLSKTPTDSIVNEAILYASIANWDTDQQNNWKFNNDHAFKNELGSTLYTIDTQEEWGPAFSKPLSELSSKASNIITAKLNVFPLSENPHLMLVFEIKSKDSILYWGGRNLINFTDHSLQWTSLIVAYQLNEIIDLRNCPADTKVNIYLWNDRKQSFWLNDFTVSAKKGNEYVYSMFGIIEK